MSVVEIGGKLILLSGAVATIGSSGGGIVFDFFISPNGDDNNAGTLGSPWSITALNTKQATYAGKKVGIIGDISGTQTPIQYGTVGGVQTTLFSIASSCNSAPGDNCILQVNGGSTGTPTYIGSCTSAGVYQAEWAIIDPANPSGQVAPVGPTMCVIGQSFYSTQTSPVPGNVGNVTLDGLVVRNGNYAGINFGDTKPNVNGLIIKNCKVYNCTCTTSANNPGGVFVANSTGTQILNCLILNCTTTGGSNNPWGMAGITGYSQLNITVTNCTISGCGYAIQLKDGNQYGTFSYNYFDCGTFGSWSNGGQGCFALMAIVPGSSQPALTVHHNIIIGNGWRSFGEDSIHTTGSANFYQNTFYANTTGQGGGSVAAVWWSPTTGAGPFQWNDNIVYYPGVAANNTNVWLGAVGLIPATGITPSQFDYNYYGTGMTWGLGATYITALSTWQGSGYDPHSIQGGSPFSGTPTSLAPNSFAITGPALTAGSTGGPVGALDGSGSVGSTLT